MFNRRYFRGAHSWLAQQLHSQQRTPALLTTPLQRSIRRSHKQPTMDAMAKFSVRALSAIAHGHWGVLDRTHYPVKDCHGITEDRNGRIVLLTNNTHNNLVAYDKSGRFLLAWRRLLAPLVLMNAPESGSIAPTPVRTSAGHPLSLSTKRPGFINEQ